LNADGEGDSNETEGYFDSVPIEADTTTNGIISCFPDDFDEADAPFLSISVLAIAFASENCEKI
jgi:hypothetical protein